VTRALDITQDWSHARSFWFDMVADYGWPGRPNLRFLEIGCFEGLTTVWLLENVLTDPTSRIDVIDTFQGSPEFEILDVAVDFEARFLRNVAPFSSKVRVYVGRSQERLLDMTGPYDFVYVDGSHHPADVLVDATLAWPMVKPGGVMVFDDYGWQVAGLPRPREAIDEFVRRYHDEIDVRLAEYQFVAEKRT